MPLPDVSRLQLHLAPLIRDCLTRNGLDPAYVRAHSQGEDGLRDPLEPTRIALLRDDPADLLFRLLFCRETLPAPQAESVLGPSLLHDCLASGILMCAETGVTAPFHLRFVRGLLLFSDYLDFHSGNGVMGAGETTAVLYQAARPASRVARALDLGCGAGTLALLLAADAEESIGTDINARAVELARFNAAVNGIGNATFRAGSLYGPVAGERFDLIVSQPPYYPKGTGAHADQVFLHGGDRGDELANAVVRGVPEHLSPDGQAVVFTSWPREVHPPHPPGMRSLELTTNRRELHGTRQSLNLYRHGGASLGRRTIPGDRWGTLTAREIDAMFAAETLLQMSDESLARMKFRLAPGVKVLREGAELLLTSPVIGHLQISESRWAALQQAIAGPIAPAVIRDALRDNLIAAVG